MDKDQEKAAKARDAALNSAITQIQREFGEGSIMKMGDEAFAVSVQAISTGALSLDLALGVGGLPRGRIVEVFGPEASGKTTLVYHVLAEAQKPRRHLCIHRRRARDGPDLRQAHRASMWTSCWCPSRTTASRRLRSPISSSAPAHDRRGGHRLGGRAHAEGRARGRDGRPDRGPSGADDEPGHAQAGRQPQQGEHALHAHQPDPREDRGHVRLAGDAAGRARAEVLFLAAPGHPPHRDPQGGHRGGRQPGAGEGGQEQGGRPVPPGRVRHRVRPGDLLRGLRPRPRGSSTTSSRSRARSSPTGTSGWARGATTSRPTCERTRTRCARSRPRSTRRWAFSPAAARWWPPSRTRPRWRPRSRSRRPSAARPVAGRG